MTVRGIRPLLKWFGSKWSAAQGGRLPEPMFDTVVEPFAGGAGYALTYCERQVVLAEINPGLLELWEWLTGPATGDEIAAMPCDIAPGTELRELGLSPQQALLLKHWQTTNSYNACSWRASSWSGQTGGWNCAVRDRIARDIERVKHWRIIDARPFGFVHWPGPATYLVDPPYQHQVFTYGCKGFDWSSLGQFCERQTEDRNQVIVCEARHPKTGALPTWLPFADNHAQKTARSGLASRELLWLGGPQPVLNFTQRSAT